MASLQFVPTQDLIALGLQMLTPSPPSNSSYKCSICNKAFSSYQALGGHKSSHRRPPIGLEPIKTASSGSAPDSSGAHRCNICYRSFVTGQGLGGHKRCHYWASSSSYHSSSNSSGGVRDFDLNLPAKEEFEFVEDGEEV